MTYTIEKKTPAGNWHAIHSGIDDDAVARFMADIAFNYSCMDDSGIDKTEMTADIQAQLDDPNTGHICGIGVCDVDDFGNAGDDHQYRAVQEAE